MSLSIYALKIWLPPAFSGTPLWNNFIYFLLTTNGYIIFCRNMLFHGLSPKNSYLTPKTHWPLFFMRSKFCLVKLKIIQDRFYVCLQGVWMNLSLSCVDTICLFLPLNPKASLLSTPTLCIWKWSASNVALKALVITEHSEQFLWLLCHFLCLPVLRFSSLIISCEILSWFHRDLSSQRTKLGGGYV